MNGDTLPVIQFEEAVVLLGTVKDTAHAFVQKVDGLYHIVTPTKRGTIAPATFVKLCNEACITSHDLRFVPTSQCREYASQLA